MIALLLSLAQRAPPTPHARDELFRSPTLAAARAEAERGRELVLALFVEEGSAPCDELKRALAEDDDLRACLESVAVGVRLEFYAEPRIAEHFAVGDAPTLLLLDERGEVLWRAHGPIPQEALRARVHTLWQAMIDRWTRELDAPREISVAAHVRLARALAAVGRDDEALQHLLWCWDLEGPAVSMRVIGEGFLDRPDALDALADLARRHPPALEALRARRHASELAILGGDGTSKLTQGLADLDEVLGETRASLRVWDLIPTLAPYVGRTAWIDSLRRPLLRTAAEPLLASGRHREILDGYGLDVVLDAMAGKRTLKLITSSSIGPGLPPAPREHIHVFEALVGVGRLDEALRLAEQWAPFGPETVPLEELVRRARRANAPDELVWALESCRGPAVRWTFEPLCWKRGMRR